MSKLQLSSRALTSGVTFRRDSRRARGKWQGLVVRGERVQCASSALAQLCFWYGTARGPAC